ncbi:cytochrome P450 2W1 isoform X2 [Balaenoptera ricei]|uniref:cytochrome P450 2W1 isoform X2 n=1 Tax=Balaenoptera ricei TaxID=2746895 RepID=UPI0028BE4EBC|nr:cytochrome P450 2W1 isoform X2 [Balaenoptera ricei]
MITWLRCFQDPPMRLPRGPQALQLAQQYGPAFTVHLGRQKTVVLTGYEAVREALLGTGQELAGRPPIVIFQLIQGGGGIFFSSGARWRAARRLTTRTLHGLGVGRAPVADKVLQEPRCLTAQLHSDGGLAPGHTASAPNHKRTLQNRHTGCGLSSRVCRDFDWRRSSDRRDTLNTSLPKVDANLLGAQKQLSPHIPQARPTGNTCFSAINATATGSMTAASSEGQGAGG